LLRLLPELAALRPDIPLPTEQTQGWQRQRFFEALARALLSLHQPLLLLLDDLQWCDGETLQWLHYFFRFAPQASVLVLAMVRIEEVPAGHSLVTSLREWQTEDLVKELTLEPLHLSETKQLVDQVAGQMLNEAQQSTLHRETEGNPLFVIEMLRAASLPQPQQDPAPDLHRSLLASSPSPFPPAIRRVLVARLAQLTPATRELVKLAAVIGREFSFTLLTHASRESEENLLRALDELWQRRIVREQGADAYDFSHGKLREQAYLFLSTPQRCFLHRRVAEALKAVYASNQDAVSAQIAAHYEQAGVLDQAIPFYLQAGKHAERVYAHEEALVTLQRAATLVETYLATQSELSWEVITAIYEEQGNILEMIGKHREAEHIYQQAKKALPAHALLARARLCRKIAATQDYPPYLEAAHQAYLEAKYTLKQAEHQERQAWREEWLQNQLGHLQVFFLLEEWREMTTIIEQIQPLIEQSATAAQRATFFTHIALRDAVRDRYVVAAETLSACQKGLQAALSTDNPHVLGATHFVLGYCLFLSDQFEQAEQELQIALSLGEQVGDAELVARCRWHFLPLVWRRLGRIEEIRRVVGEVQARGERRYYALFSAQQAWLDWRDGKQEEAEEASPATTHFKQPQRPPYPFQWTGLWPQIAVAVQAKQIPLAVNAVRQLLSPQQQLPPEKLRAALEEIVQVEEGEQLHSLLNYAVQLAQEMGYL
ncbi:MAG TPA: hypothetical protein VFN35_15475, partial [Ktedonobacteraceae bacterium]|nr:hypothetical protein [Ktedonobacteraceae bacterium]